MSVFITAKMNPALDSAGKGLDVFVDVQVVNNI